MPSTHVVETERLILRRLDVDDAEFILELLNEPSFLRFVGDKGVRTLEDARRYITDGPMTSYERFGFGLYLTLVKEDATPIGICGLLQRDNLDDADVGFAFRPRYWSKGYARESAAAVVEHGRRDFGLRRIVAITASDNHGSIKVLERLGFHFERMIAMKGDESEIKLFAWEVVDETGSARG